MSRGESLQSLRHYEIKNSTKWQVTGYYRINIEDYILRVPYDIFDIMTISHVSFTVSEWKKIQEYTDKARELGKIVTFESCYVYEDDFLQKPFFTINKESVCYRDYMIDHPLLEENNYNKVKFKSTESIKEWAEAYNRGENKPFLLVGENINVLKNNI